MFSSQKSPALGLSRRRILSLALFVGVIAALAGLPNTASAATADSNGSALSAAVEPIVKIPKGIQPGRENAIYGSYYTVVKESARALQDRVNNLENRVLGFGQLSDQDPVKQSEALFTLEHAIMKLVLDISNAPDSLFSENSKEKEMLLFAATRSYSSLRIQGERLFENMVRFIDVKLPGPNGLQFRTDLEDELSSLYLPNYRSDDTLTAEQRATLYKAKVKEFTDKGGSLTEIKKLTPELLEKMGPYTRVEYVVRQNGDYYVTEGNAGHILLAEGNAVKAGGQLVFLKNNLGQFIMLVASNSSGSFKPDLYSVYLVRHSLLNMTKVPEQAFILTKGEPISTQGVKVYSKGLGLAKDVTQARLDRLNRIEKTLRDLKFTIKNKAQSCNAFFLKAI